MEIVQLHMAQHLNLNQQSNMNTDINMHININANMNENTAYIAYVSPDISTTTMLRHI